jgi:hypothetical protein
VPYDNNTALANIYLQAFEGHQPEALQHSMTAFAAGPQPDRSTPNSDTSYIQRHEPWSDSQKDHSRLPYALQTSSKAPIPGARAMFSLIPPQKATELLVNTYFDRVHWFILAFHQDEFRGRVQRLYENPQSQSSDIPYTLSFTSMLLAVLAIGLEYAGEYRNGLLAYFGVTPHSLKEQIFSTLKSHILDIVSSGSLEAVQTCLLLGSYYLYHGNPGMAMPIFGCGLRVAQALNLHRRSSITNRSTHTDLSALHQRNEAKKRCWWAIYETETFCSMLYGYPRSISDADCDVELLDPSNESSKIKGLRPSKALLSSRTKLLSYKYFMSRLSIIINCALTDLYGTRQDPADHRSRALDRTKRLQKLVKKVSDLDRRLHNWHEELPSNLQVKTYRETILDPNLAESLEKDIGASDGRFTSQLLRLQALSLKLAYENARILVHRPLVSFQTNSPAFDNELESTCRPISKRSDPFQVSLQTCRDAALQTAEVGSTSVFQEAIDTYAVAFVGIHIFTAGVTLCVLANLDPMSMQSQEYKIGVHKLMEMEICLKPKSVLAAQGLEVLQKLAKVILEKELEKMLSLSKPSNKSNNDSYLVQKDDASSNEKKRSQGNKSISQYHSLRSAPSQQDASGIISPLEAPSIPEISTTMTDSLETGDGSEFSFLENTTMAEVLLDFDQGKSLL